MKGSQYNDKMIDISGQTSTNNTGGISGGISNGNDIVFRVAVRPTASISKVQTAFNIKEEKPEKISVEGRHDTCIALRMPVIVEAASAIALCDLMLISGLLKK
jgi:chorismate synthase